MAAPLLVRMRINAVMFCFVLVLVCFSFELRCSVVRHDGNLLMLIQISIEAKRHKEFANVKAYVCRLYKGDTCSLLMRELLGHS